MPSVGQKRQKTKTIEEKYEEGCYRVQELEQELHSMEFQTTFQRTKFCRKINSQKERNRKILEVI